MAKKVITSSLVSKLEQRRGLLKVSLVLMLMLSMVTVGSLSLMTITSSAASTSIINEKALLITAANDYYSAPYNQQVAVNIMRDWGIPFDTINIGSVTPSTFWDSTNQVNKYAYVVYFGARSIQDEPLDSSEAISALEGAQANGTNILFFGPSIHSYGQHFFGISTYLDCPANPTSGGNCLTTSFKMNVLQTFSGIETGQPTFNSGLTLTASNFPNVAILQVGNPTTGTEFMSYSVSGPNYPAAMYLRGSGGGIVWWISGVEGIYSFYRNGWQDLFANGLYPLTSNEYQFYQPMRDLFFYALNNISQGIPRILPWSYGGSAEIIRVGDHESICAYTDCASSSSPEIEGMLNRGLVGDIDLNVNGWSNSQEISVSPGAPSGSLAFPCNTAYSFNGHFNAGMRDYFGVCAQLDNQSSTSNSGQYTTITSSHFITLNFADGNTTEIIDAKVLVSTTGSPNWKFSILDDSGKTIYTSSTQTTSYSSPTWVDFQATARAGDSGYVSNLQGNIQVGITVNSGSVLWYNNTSTRADYVVLGRSNWDIVYVATNAHSMNDNDFTSSVALVPDSIRMANGQLFPQANATVWTGSPGNFHPADIVGDTNAGAPDGVNFEYLFNSTDISRYGGGLISNLQSLYTKGFNFETNGWTHAKTSSLSFDNDFVYGNGTTMNNAEASARIGDIVSATDSLGVVWNSYWAFGTSAQTYYPKMNVMTSNHYMNFTYAQLATEQNSILGYENGGFYQTKSGNLLDAGQNVKETTDGSLFSFNQTRDVFGLIESHSDANYPWSMYDSFKSAGWTMQYDPSSTWFCGTTLRCLSFYQDSLNMLRSVAQFYWNPSTDQFVISGDMGSSSLINSTLNDPLIWRFPTVASSGDLLLSVSDTQSSGSIVNTTSSWDSYGITRAQGATTIVASYKNQIIPLPEVPLGSLGVLGASILAIVTYLSLIKFSGPRKAKMRGIFFQRKE